MKERRGDQTQNPMGKGEKVPLQTGATILALEQTYPNSNKNANVHDTYRIFNQFLCMNSCC